MINHWIATILLFDFKLIHILANKHHGPNGLSCHPPAEGEEEKEDLEEWINHMLSLGLWVLTWLNTPQYVQVLSLTQAPSSDNSTFEEPLRFPVSEKALQAKEELTHIEHYLHSLQLPPGLSNKGLARLLRMAACFFLLNG
jgi:hypothetical protein